MEEATTGTAIGRPTTSKREVVKQRDDIGWRMIILTTGKVLLGHISSSRGEVRGRQQQRRAWWASEASEWTVSGLKS